MNKNKFTSKNYSKKKSSRKTVRNSSYSSSSYESLLSDFSDYNLNSSLYDSEINHYGNKFLKKIKLNDQTILLFHEFFDSENSFKYNLKKKNHSLLLLKLLQFFDKLILMIANRTNKFYYDNFSPSKIITRGENYTYSSDEKNFNDSYKYNKNLQQHLKKFPYYDNRYSFGNREDFPNQSNKKLQELKRNLNEPYHDPFKDEYNNNHFNRNLIESNYSANGGNAQNYHPRNVDIPLYNDDKLMYNNNNRFCII